MPPNRSTGWCGAVARRIHPPILVQDGPRVIAASVQGENRWDARIPGGGHDMEPKIEMISPGATVPTGKYPVSPGNRLAVLATQLTSPHWTAL